MKILELQLWTRALATQRKFYTDILNLTVAEASADTLSLQAGASRLVFQQAPADWQGVYHFAFNIPENQFKEAKAWLASRVSLMADTLGADDFFFEDWNAHAAYSCDPAGNIVELIARHGLPTASARPFTGRSLLSISEVGIVANHVPDTVQLICSRLGVAVYRGAGSATFTAVGDEQGLLIVVQRGRIWFPDSGKAADFAPLSALVEPEAGQRYTVMSNDETLIASLGG